MYCPDKLKLNKFQFVRIPKMKEIFGRYGAASVDPNSYTGDEPGVLAGRKVDMIAEANEAYEQYAKAMSEEEKK